MSSQRLFARCRLNVILCRQPPNVLLSPLNCKRVIFSLQPLTYASDSARVAFVISLLAGRARKWVTSVWAAKAACCKDFSSFKAEFSKIFNSSELGKETSRLWAALRQGIRSVEDCTIVFRTLAASISDAPVHSPALEPMQLGRRSRLISPESLRSTMICGRSSVTHGPHLFRPYDCAINLLPGTSPPKGRLFSLSAPERAAMEKYFSESLVAGVIHPSSSLVGIREGDEWKTAFNTPMGPFENRVLPFGLINAPAVFQVHIQHVRRVLQRLLENQLFVKAEKCSFHNQRFIHNFGQVAAPLTALTSTKKPFCWSSVTQAAFDKLERRFSSAPILITPDPTRQFVVEVDASEVSEAAVPSVQAFISRCTSENQGTHQEIGGPQAPRYICGQKLWLSTKDLPLKVPSKKLAPRFIGPYPIVKIAWENVVL
ncbi:hypothetical protein PO909_008846 [Leuciscus waleckii]